MQLHTVYMAYSESLPTRLNPLVERTCFSQAHSSLCTLQLLLTLGADQGCERKGSQGSHMTPWHPVEDPPDALQIGNAP
jgi:hypothetical protein